MLNNAAPALDGMNAAFYKASWSWASTDVHKLVSTFYSSGKLPPEINNTHIALIPKTTSPFTPKGFRPISLCNVSYKIIASLLQIALSIIWQILFIPIKKLLSRVGI
jgi:hypothetical protein